MKSVKSVLLITCILFVIKTDPVDSFKLLRHKRQTNGSPIPSRCLHMPDSGLCLARYVNYYYNSATGNCETFVYGGCGGNDNNFWSMHDCEVACKNRELNEGEENDFQLIMESLEPLVENKDDCEYPPETGECEAIFMRYYFNGEKCETFVYGGCGGNPNNFQTEEGCIERCIIKPTTENVDEDIIKLIKETFAPLDESKDVCEYPPVTGICRALFRNYYFNGEKCEIFIYGGCGGNPNNFRTEEECIERCMPASETENSEENEI